MLSQRNLCKVLRAMQFRAFAIGLVTCWGCAAKTPPPAVAVDSGPKPQAVEAESPPDLSPVAAPDELVLVGRLARPRLLVETVAGWAGMPVKLSDLMPVELRGVEGVVAWDAPVELAAVLDRHSTAKVAPPLTVLSIGLTSLPRALDLARERGVVPTRVAAAVYRLPVADEITCALAAAVGAAPARLVCGTEWQSVEELLPYATRGLPAENLGADDLHLELRAAPLQRRYAQEIAAVRLLTGLLLRQGQSGSPRFDRALTDAAYGLADELKAIAMEIDKVEIRARLDEGNKALELGGVLAFSKDSSFVAQLIDDTRKRAAPPPEAFWQLPRTVESGAYTVGLDAKRVTAVTSVGAELVDAYLEQQMAAAPLRTRVRGMFDALPVLASAGAVAIGSVPVPKEPTAVDRFNQGIGWRVSVIDARADQLSKLLLNLEAVLADRTLPKLAKDRWGVEARRLPKVRHRVLRVAGFPTAATSFTMDVPAALLDALKSRESSVAGGGADKKPKPAGRGATPTLIVVADGEKTWMALAPDEKSALARLESARAGKDGKLSDVPELAALKTVSNVTAGYSTLEGMLRMLQSMFPKKGRGDVSDLLSHAPNRGRTPQLSWVSSTRMGTGLRVSATWRLPQAAFQDLGGLVPSLVSPSSR